MTTYESFEALDDLTREAVADLLFRMADDELIMGHRGSEWTGLAPILEEDIAFSSIAQDEICHSQVYSLFSIAFLAAPITDSRPPISSTVRFARSM